ncbi:hypothetical protein [Nonomuraea sp. NPDC003214]
MVTPKIEYLRHLARDQIDHERGAWLARSGALRARLAEARERRQAAEHTARVARLAWVEARTWVPDPDERRLAETIRDGRPGSLVRARRQADHARRCAAAETVWAAAESRLAAAVREVEAVTQELARAEAGNRVRVRRIHEFTSRRVAAYLQQLVRTHPHGPELNARLDLLAPELPAWAEEDRPEPQAHDHPRTDAHERRPWVNGHVRTRGGEVPDGTMAP